MNSGIVNVSIQDVAAQLEKLSHSKRFSLTKDNIANAANLITQNKEIGLRIVDHTNAGGLHKVDVTIYTPKSHVIILVPKEPTENEGIKGGRYPTLLHAVEIVVAIFRLSGHDFPKITFKPSPDNEELTKIDPTNQLLMPLTIDPDNTNVMIFHTQAPRVEQESLARCWYEVMKADENLINDPIRHTILVMPVSDAPDRPNPHFPTDQPKLKSQVYSEVLPKEVVNNRGRFRPMYLKRIRSWNISKPNSQIIPKIEYSYPRNIIYLK